MAGAPALLGADLPAASTPAARAPAAHVTAAVTALRSHKGQVAACLTALPRAFPDCERDPRAIVRFARAQTGAVVDFGPIAPGRYAIALFHDENGNGRLDKTLMLPAEGYGFSRDAPVRFGPPSFARAAFTVGTADQALTIRMRYLF